jgi:NADPH:quinone reductase-like Zn-dependent oxidoreductase
VAATSFNSADAAIRMGILKDFLPKEFPYTLGMDVSGVIEVAGDSVKDFNTGDKVKVFAFLDISRNGAVAEYVITKAIDIALARQITDTNETAAITAAANSDWQGLFDHGNL